MALTDIQPENFIFDPLSFHAGRMRADSDSVDLAANNYRQGLREGRQFGEQEGFQLGHEQGMRDGRRKCLEEECNPAIDKANAIITKQHRDIGVMQQDIEQRRKIFDQQNELILALQNKIASLEEDKRIAQSQMSEMRDALQDTAEAQLIARNTQLREDLERLTLLHSATSERRDELEELLDSYKEAVAGYGSKLNELDSALKAEQENYNELLGEFNRVIIVLNTSRFVLTEVMNNEPDISEETRQRIRESFNTKLAENESEGLHKGAIDKRLADDKGFGRSLPQTKDFIVSMMRGVNTPVQKVEVADEFDTTL